MLLRALAAVGLAAVGLAASVVPGAAAQAPGTPPPRERRTFEIKRAAGPISVDGAVDEAAWQDALLVTLDLETRPGENVPAPVRTECRLAYDERHLYVGIRAFDPDPGSIRAHLTDRDRSFQDDFAGIVIDTFDDGRRAYEIFVNPLGVQMDLIQDDVAGIEDESWDAIWASGGRLTAEGYEVELAIPFTSLRFPRGGGIQTWGFDALRIYPRDARRILRSQAVDRNVSCYLCQVSRLTGIEGISPGRNLELAPTLTGFRADARPEGGEGIEAGEGKAELGMTATWGMTPNLTLNAAVNPDFSQVEADAAQLDINTPFALFFPERRPFFLEGADFFTTPLSAVFTRNVADPSWGLKLSGKVGPNALGVFVARDEITNLLLPGPEGSSTVSLSLESTDAVLRYRRDIGAGATFGALATLRDGDGFSSRVLGADGRVRITERDTVSLQVLTSQTEYPEEAVEEDVPAGHIDDRAIHALYTHDERSWSWVAQYQDIGPDFRADMGFMPQVGFRQGLAGMNRFWHGDEETWYRRINLGGDWDRTEDAEGNLLEQEWEVWWFAEGPRQSFLNVDVGIRDRSFEGVPFEDHAFAYVSVDATPSGVFSGGIGANWADAIDYANVREGQSLAIYPYVNVTPGRHLRLEVSHTLQDLDVDGGRLFRANLTELRAVWQFDRRMLLRAILQHTDVARDPELYTFEVPERTRDVFGQLLFSYKINPRTVLFVGATDRQEELPELGLTETERTAFLKLGYAWQM